MTESSTQAIGLAAAAIVTAGVMCLRRRRRRRSTQRESGKKHFVIGSRSSELAMIQSRHVKALMESAFPDCAFEISSKKTHGDKVLDKPLAVLAGATPGLFTKDLEVGLVSGHFDFIVHSLKDMPTTLPDGLVLAAVTEREDPRDALLVRSEHKGCGGLEGLPDGSVVGTSSVRRAALIRKRFPKLECRSVRGNLQTRLRKLQDPKGPFDALVLAVAGLKRLQWTNRIEAVLEWMPYGVGQGALGIECRASDTRVLRMLCDATEHSSSAKRCLAERAAMRVLQGGCQVPIAVHSEFENTSSLLRLRGVVLSVDGSVAVEASLQRACTSNADASALGEELGKALLTRGARDILDGHKDGIRPVTYSTVATG